MDTERPVKRTGIFCFYDRNGQVSDDVLYLLNELRKNLSFLVIVVNGFAEQTDKLQSFADLFLTRPNTGFDAGAYKYALRDDRVRSAIEESDELILCNDTFFGPFVPLEEIFSEMSAKNCDFWGLNLSVSGFEDFLQSYFLVFRSAILRSGILHTFFEQNIAEETTDIRRVLFLFERDMMRFLRQAGFRAGAYCTQKHHIFREPDGSVILDHLPLLKKKALQDDYFDVLKARNILTWLKQETEYPPDLILKQLPDGKQKEILKGLTGHSICLSTERLETEADVKIKQICDFLNGDNPSYIYGIGKIASEIVELLERYLPDWRNRVSGFVISNEEKTDLKAFQGCRILRLSDVADRESADLLLALGRKNTEAVLEKTGGFHRIMKLKES